jgi:hypothetical protein
MTYRYEPDGTWTVLCDEDESVIESGFLTLAFAVEDVAEGDCTTCAERVAEAASGIPREYAEN